MSVVPITSPDLDAAEAAGLPMLPGAATASEAMRLLDRGYDMLKFFPAEAAVIHAPVKPQTKIDVLDY